MMSEIIHMILAFQSIMLLVLLAGIYWVWWKADTIEDLLERHLEDGNAHCVGEPWATIAKTRKK